MAARAFSATTFGIVRVELVRQGLDLGVAALDERPRRNLEGRRGSGGSCRRRRRPTLSLRDDQHRAQRNGDRRHQRRQTDYARQGAFHLDSYYICRSQSENRSVTALFESRHGQFARLVATKARRHEGFFA